MVRFSVPLMALSMDWLKVKSTGNHRFSHDIWRFPIIFPLDQSIDLMPLLLALHIMPETTSAPWLCQETCHSVGSVLGHEEMDA